MANVHRVSAVCPYFHHCETKGYRIILTASNILLDENSNYFMKQILQAHCLVNHLWCFFMQINLIPDRCPMQVKVFGQM